MRRPRVIIARALVDLVRRPAVTGLTVGTVAVVFLLLGLFGLLASNFSLLADRLSSRLRLTVFVEDDCRRECRQRLQQWLRSRPAVAGVVVVGRQQALEDFRRRLGNDAHLLDLLGENPLPASLQVDLHPGKRRAESLAALAAGLEKLPGVEEVQYGQRWLGRFFQFIGVLRTLGLVLGGLILLAAAVIVSNTIRLSVYSRRQEIEIMSLVGATTAFIKAPFYLQGALVGLLGAGLGVGLAYLAFLVVAPWLRMPVGLGQSSFTPAFLAPATVALVTAGGALLGLAGTAASLWRHLRK